MQLQLIYSFSFPFNFYPQKKKVDGTTIRRCVTTKLELDQHCSEESIEMTAAILKSMTGKDSKVTCEPCTTDGCNGATQ